MLDVVLPLYITRESVSQSVSQSVSDVVPGVILGYSNKTLPN